MKQRIACIAVALTAVISLTGCGESAPSASEAATAVSDAVAKDPGLQMLYAMASGGKATGAMPAVKVDVSDLKCQKLGDGLYNCVVSGSTNGSAWPAPQTIKFTKLNGAWQAALH